jgi:hypothetical protein
VESDHVIRATTANLTVTFDQASRVGRSITISVGSFAPLKISAVGGVSLSTSEFRMIGLNETWKFTYIANNAIVASKIENSFAGSITIAGTGSTTVGSNLITTFSAPSQVQIGAGISGVGIPANSFVQNVVGANLTISQNSTAAGSPILTVVNNALAGNVPIALSGDNLKFLRGDATWQTIVANPGMILDPTERTASFSAVRNTIYYVNTTGGPINVTTFSYAS